MIIIKILDTLEQGLLWLSDTILDAIDAALHRWPGLIVTAWIILFTWTLINLFIQIGGK